VRVYVLFMLSCYKANVSSTIHYIPFSTIHCQIKLFLWPSNPQLTLETLQIQYCYSLIIEYFTTGIFVGIMKHPILEKNKFCLTLITINNVFGIWCTCISIHLFNSIQSYSNWIDYFKENSITYLDGINISMTMQLTVLYCKQYWWIIIWNNFYYRLVETIS